MRNQFTGTGLNLYISLLKITMETLGSNQKIKGPVYVLKIKSSKEYNSTELLYALAFKGDSSFGLMNFKEVAEVENRTYCLVQKVDNGNDVTWSQCMSQGSHSFLKI